MTKAGATSDEDTNSLPCEKPGWPTRRVPSATAWRNLEVCSGLSLFLFSLAFALGQLHLDGFIRWKPKAISKCPEGIESVHTFGLISDILYWLFR
eukprot:CAMPEP_0172765900 /NCGR_PEP_ID=MMETSP1074-20121228/180184_1 /TAXON_ID=2916 /ORGANISM="Ceratium fusus, Strain PA161109" /LENGTH=94 /DNA_ID=CAMNT_0013600919 /DNA_START=57 /DNA_END=341 /DNA_ORIENTATION=-